MLIRNKLLLLATLVLFTIGLLVSEFVAIYSLQREYAKSELLIQQQKINLLTLRRHEKDFIEREQKHYIEAYESTLLDSAAQLTLLDRQLSALFAGPVDEVNRIRQQFEVYHGHFTELADLMIVVGLDPSSGLRNRVKVHVNTIRKMLAEYPMLLLRFQELIEIQNSYEIRPNQNQAAYFDQSIEVFLLLVERTYRLENKGVIKDHVRQLHTAFKQLVQSIVQLGITAEEGMRFKVRASAHELEETLDKTVVLLNRQMVGAMQQRERNAVILASLVILILVLGVVIVSHRVNRSTKVLVAQIKAVDLKQNPGFRLRHGGHDELAFVVTEFNSLLDKVAQLNDEVSDSKVTERLAAEKIHVRDEFLASMSHELRTPLTAILGYCDILLDGQSDPGQRKCLKAIRSSGEGQLALVNDILDMSKIESGKFTVEMAPFSLESVVDEVQSMLSVKAQDAGLALEVSQSEQEPFNLLGDRQRIKQVLINLVGNAIKFTEQGSVTLAVERENRDILFDVTDTGIGIKPENIDNLFQRFEQEDGTIARRFGGSGLGLFISQNLAELMGGSLTVRSEYGKGSTFSFRIPYVISDVTEQPGIESQQSDEPSQQLRGRVLLAEDTPILQQLLKRMLTKFGLEVDIAENGVVAVEKVLSGSYALVLMDMQMPEMDGIEATRVLRSKGVTLPVIATTANVMQKHIDRFNEAGCDDFLGKPIDQEQLKATLQKYLRADEESRHKGGIDRVLLTPIEWQESFSVGCSLMDEHHQLVIALINQLIESYSQFDQPESRKVVRKTLVELNRYADTHLIAEEELLESIHYKELDAHKKVHDRYRGMVASFYEFELTESNVGQLLLMLRKWWMNHILEEDMAYKTDVEASQEKSGLC